MTSKQKTIYNFLFLFICGSLLIFLYYAPEETTKRLPQDEIHSRFHPMEKKAAEVFCEPCHNPEGQVPLPEHHPPKYRCLFCHKQTK